ncbi:hypothetical protein [Paraflavitalea speifideaquila]|uniref:hypothetical protein n=1 Tax=Paraflavitalea speifideaquila TaxID=3076558 RepID=UPI0028E46E9D|nr:hypothetical protein [Paraflavitalea speifideiaquila]
MKRRIFLQQTGLAGAGLLMGPLKGFSTGNADQQFPVVRIPVEKGILAVLR